MMFDPTNNVFGFIKDARLRYLQYLDAGGQEISVINYPHMSSGIVAVYDSQLGMCPKKAAMERAATEPTHPHLAKMSLGEMHRMRDGVVSESEWIGTLLFIEYTEKAWMCTRGLRVDRSTRGMIDAWLEIPESLDPIKIAEWSYSHILVEFKRTDGNIKEAYLFQICSYLDKFGIDGGAIGKLILDHRHTIEEFTVIPYFDDFGSVLGWQVFNEQGVSVDKMTVEKLHGEVLAHKQWLNTTIKDGPQSTLPAGIESPLSSWQCHQSWVKSKGEARFRCQFAGWCFGIKADRFAVHNEKEGRKIAARLVIADDGREFRLEVSEEE